ncbi:MAG: iron export ABC transporter permease subunit FetB [Gammaproteobacteria bacterium]|nr:iron export ABC transporter permease subunit FetB [Gammaproteobacteria bacterium]
MITLDALDLGLAAALVIALAVLAWRLQLGMTGALLVAALRTVVQLLLIGLVLRVVFAYVNPLWVALLAMAMLLAAGREVWARQSRRFTGLWGFGIGTSSLFISSFAVTVLALVVSVGPDPWYQPRYSIPLLGMVLGNTMTGIALAMDRLNAGAWNERRVIEARLCTGADWPAASLKLRRDAMRVGLLPIINAMAAAGIISLPGMMTGQLLAGAPPMEAVKYQILIMLLIAAGTGFGTVLAVQLAARRLSDARHRLRLDRLDAQAR